MGRVVAATHVVLGQRVALKVLTRTTTARATSRFLREARLAFRLTSAHVAKVFDAGELENGVPYIAMELLDGVDLAKLSHDRGPLPVAEACSYIAQACAGISQAHALGTVHRDVKLANLVLATTPRGPIVKVLDFGCAKAERIGATSLAHVTRQDALLGTPRFMSPEQFASSRDVDARADVWSLGVALYTLLAGRPPFNGETLSVLFEQIVRAPAPPIPWTLPPVRARFVFVLVAGCACAHATDTPDYEAVLPDGRTTPVEAVAPEWARSRTWLSSTPSVVCSGPGECREVIGIRACPAPGTMPDRTKCIQCGHRESRPATRRFHPARALITLTWPGRTGPRIFSIACV